MLSMNRGFQILSSVESGGAPPHSKTLARWFQGPKIRQVLECAAAAALWMSHEVQDPNAYAKSERPPHEATHT